LVQGNVILTEYMLKRSLVQILLYRLRAVPAARLAVSTCWRTHEAFVPVSKSHPLEVILRWSTNCPRSLVNNSGCKV